jgi:hypothetical protein
MQPRRDRALSSTSGRVALRFCVRLALLIALAGLAHAGFRTALPGFLITAGIFCACWALFSREPLFAPTLTHWDEAALLVVLGKIAFVVL